MAGARVGTRRAERRRHPEPTHRAPAYRAPAHPGMIHRAILEQWIETDSGRRSRSRREVATYPTARADELADAWEPEAREPQASDSVSSSFFSV